MTRPAVVVPGLIRLVRPAVLASTMFVIGCGAASPTQPSSGGPPVTFTATSGAQVLIDASKDGGIWWFPQSGPYDVSAKHQGQALAGAIRARGFTVDELPRGAAISSALLANYRLIIRVGACASYSSAEITAYEHQLSRDMTLMLLTDHMNGGCTQTDPLALRFGGITWSGAETGTVTTFANHPITAEMSQLQYIAGATVVSMTTPSSVELLGFIGPSQKPVMGIIKGFAAKIFFLGDSNGIEAVPQPFINNLLAWAF